MDHTSSTASNTKEKEHSLVTPQHASSVGLGLTMNLDERHSSSTMRTPRALQSPQAVPEPAETTMSYVENDPFTIVETAAVRHMSKRHLGEASTNLEENGDHQQVMPDDFQVPLDRALLLRNRIEASRRREARNSIVELEERTVSPQSNRSRLSSPDSLPADTKRISQLSTGSSAVVEAVVLDTPKRRKQKLRHCSKNASLRDAGSPVSGSNRSSLVSSEAKSRLQPKAAVTPINRNRTSLNSDSGISMGFEFIHKEPDTPYKEVGGKEPSLRASSNERKLNRSIASDHAYNASSRPTTAPEGASPKVRATSLPLRSVSDIGSKPPLENRGRELQRSKLTIPQRTSSLSAPTTRNHSRAATLMSGDRAKVSEVEHLEFSEGRCASSAKEVPAISIEPGDSCPEDHQRVVKLRPSLTRTPISVVSAASFQSSTPGPVELNEATAISIYPHNNKSVLVVQHSTTKGLEKATTSARLTNNVTVELRNPAENRPLPLSRVVANSDNGGILDHSPARPAVVLIPPTPANAPLRGEAGEVVIVGQWKRSASGPFSSIKRAFSARRYSDTVIAPLSKLLPAQSDVIVKKRTKIDSGSRALSPFWRPRGFWDDFSDNESNGEEYSHVRNTVGLPQKRVVTGPVGLVRRLGPLKKRIETTLPNGYPTERRLSMPTLRSRSYGSAEGMTTVFKDRLRRWSSDDNNPISNFYENLKRKKAERAEAKQGKERERLKRSIKPVLPQGLVSVFE
ncbi:MAG: hypothetical protein LQ340_001056 [Diploschistes diacapsis]|nr:MAG: hypothetical protein LQ340_001056 [Diploschistes diacapsis]